MLSKKPPNKKIRFSAAALPSSSFTVWMQQGKGEK